jgi:hypothetical protein
MIALADDGANPLLTSPRGGILNSPPSGGVGGGVEGGYYDDCPYHGVGLGVLHAVASQLQAPAHVHFIYLLLIHGAKIKNIRGKNKRKDRKGDEKFGCIGYFL